jgi:hypothetical protein
MGQPLKIGGRDERYSRVTNKNAFDTALDSAGIGSQHADGVSSQRGRTTIKYRDGKRIVVRENGRVLLPEEGTGKRAIVSLYQVLERSGRIEHA